MLDISAAWNLLCDLERSEDTKRFLIGNRFGGGVSYLFGNQCQTVDWIFLTAPVLSYVEDIGNMAEAWDADQLSTFRYVKFDLSSLLVPEMHYFDERIKDISNRVPFTIIHGKADADVPFADSEAFVAKRSAGEIIGLAEMDHCWAKPGDLPPFNDSTSIENRSLAINITVEQMLKSVS
jgi:predicted alpha/beta hydrolase